MAKIPEKISLGKNPRANSAVFLFLLYRVNTAGLLFGTDSDQNRMLEEIPRSGADSLPLIKPLRHTRTLCGQTQTQV
jgi:hypothetical protein